MHREAFLKLQHNVHFIPICIPIHRLLHIKESKGINRNHEIIQLTPLRMKQRIGQLLHLPLLPNIIGKLVNCRLIHAPKNDLVSLIKTDPSLSLQVLSWSQSSKQRYIPPMKSVESAISNLLGYDLTLNLSLMTALSEPLKMPKTGRLGWQKYWRAALYAAILSDSLAQLIHPHLQEKQHLAYYSGLFHNIGLLILSELFPSYYALLNQLVQINNHLSINMVEQYAFGLTHHQLAIWLMQAWTLPQEIINGMDWYKNESNELLGEEAKIVRLATHLLAQQRIGEGPLILPEAALCEALGLTQDQAKMALKKCLLQEGRLGEHDWV
jgi:HD-like signal output (HDOD) protein